MVTFLGTHCVDQVSYPFQRQEEQCVAFFSWQIGANFHHHLGRHNHHNRSLAPIRHTEFLDEVLGVTLHPVTLRTIFLLVFYHFDSFVETCRAIQANFFVGSSSVMLNLWWDECHPCSNAKEKVIKRLVFKQIDLSFLVMEGVQCEGDQVSRLIELSFPMACLKIEAACSHCNVTDTLCL
jgi:hypothetical protein